MKLKVTRPGLFGRVAIVVAPRKAELCKFVGMSSVELGRRGMASLLL